MTGPITPTRGCPAALTDTRFNTSLALGEGLRADSVCRVSERSHNTTVCPTFTTRHYFAYFGIILFLIIAKGILDLRRLD